MLTPLPTRSRLLGVPPWSLSLSKKYRDFELSFLGILVFRKTFGSIRPNFDSVSNNSDLLQTILPGGPDLFSLFTYFDLFCWADLTYFHLFGPMSFHNKAPWAGHQKTMVDNPLTSYRIGNPRNAKIPPQHTKREIP